MRVAISGTHGSGKSTLISDFAMSHREWSVLPDPYEYIDASEEAAGAAAFGKQLAVTARRLARRAAEPQIAERSPLDFLAYLHALDALRRPGDAADLFELNFWVASRAMKNIDLLVLLPLWGGRAFTRTGWRSGGTSGKDQGCQRQQANQAEIRHDNP